MPPVPVVAVGAAAVVFTTAAAVTGSVALGGLLAVTVLACVGAAALMI
ncbi:hypothetical protein G4X40_05175 [Rhodococcus sp. D2-41]|uniref:Uncharacterized protein n=1 Tax=Speluncibacter jeojiensis TaxID=2710754 RepID=A0A9X4RFB5_9ACTN|nr:hypothetical protein [Rhodococcus sp. D2-41]MDG3009535.1 hypothetical protein [Rhodococcus sp. D2-41]MDG3016463.1 hypothetical protein [Corynebacteriales bacterium D3-21]